MVSDGRKKNVDRKKNRKGTEYERIYGEEGNFYVNIIQPALISVFFCSLFFFVGFGFFHKFKFICMDIRYILFLILFFFKTTIYNPPLLLYTLICSELKWTAAIKKFININIRTYIFIRDDSRRRYCMYTHERRYISFERTNERKTATSHSEKLTNRGVLLFFFFVLLHSLSFIIIFNDLQHDGGGIEIGIGI